MGLVGHSLVVADEARGAVGQAVPNGCCGPDEHMGYVASVHLQVYVNAIEIVGSGKHPVVGHRWGSDDNSGSDDKSDESVDSREYQ